MSDDSFITPLSVPSLVPLSNLGHEPIGHISIHVLADETINVNHKIIDGFLRLRMLLFQLLQIFALLVIVIL